MTTQVLKVLTNEQGDERVVVIRRPDGAYSYRREQHGRDGWSSGIDIGLYDSAETAESEARARTVWLAPLFH